MNNSMKLYNKAVKLYNEGYIDKALEQCEKSISDNIKNRAAINFKGLLYYFKGELYNAEALWKMNFQVNRDLIAKKYLEDSENDKNKLLVYKAANTAINESKYKEALNLLQICKESDFNNINVNNSIAICYIKLGEYNNAKKYIEEVIKVDRKNAVSAKSIKDLKNIHVMKSKYKIKYGNLLIACVVLFMIIGLTGFTIKNIIKVKKPVENNIVGGVKLKQTSNKDDISSKKNISSNDEKTIEKLFPSEELNKAINEKDYEKLYNIANEWKDKDINTIDKDSLKKGIELLQSSSSLEYLYEQGRKAIKINDYKTSEKYFMMTYNYGKEYYLYQDILYMLGYSYKNDGQIDNCLKFYKEYDEKFPSGNYEVTILYDMSLIYKSNDLNLSKRYASRIVKQYPNSIYNNNVIKDILAS